MRSHLRTSFHPSPFALTRIVGLVLSALMFATPTLAGTVSILIDAETGRVLVSNQPTQRWYPASLTKLMTLYVTFAAIEAGQFALGDDLTVSAHAAAQRGSALGLRVGETISLHDAILAVITQSANDATMVLAEAVGRGETTFVATMNQQAQALGLVQSHFTNPTGLPDAQQATTARDMAVLARAIWHDFPQYYHFFATTHLRFGRFNLPTINGILASYRGADGLKTGSTCDAGYNLVASAVRDGRRLIGVVLGANSAAIRSAEMTKLLDEGFAVAATGSNGGMEPIGLPPNAAPPPHRLGGSECTAGAAFAAVRVPELPGWGLVLGTYPQEFRAERAIELVKPGLNLSAPTVRPVVIPLKGTNFFSAILVGLSEREADAACLLLRRRGAYCVKLTPQTLNNPEALRTAIDEHDSLGQSRTRAVTQPPNRAGGPAGD